MAKVAVGKNNMYGMIILLRNLNCKMRERNII